MLKHGHSPAGKSSRTYQTWASMLQRCLNPRNSKFKHYGGRGITVCDRWRDFSAFLVDMGERPEGLSLERKKNELGYSPDNCEWATASAQARNRRATVWIEIGGRLQCMSDWCTELGIGFTTVFGRIHIQGMTPVQALTTPVNPDWRGINARKRRRRACASQG